MAYTTATPSQKPSISPNGTLIFSVTFSGNAGEPPVDKRYEVSSLADLPTLLSQDRQGLNQLLVVANKITVGQALALPVIGVSTSTGPSVQQTAFIAAIATYRNVSKAVAVGLMSTSDLDTAQSLLSSAYVPGFESLL